MRCNGFTFAMLVSICSVLTTSNTRADFFTEEATVDITAEGVAGDPPVNFVETLHFNSAGRIYTNTIAGGGPGGVNLIRTVGANVGLDVSGGTDAGETGFIYDAVRGAGSNANRVIAVFGVEGVALDPAGSTVQFQTGKLWLFEDSVASGFSGLDPNSWSSDAIAAGNIDFSQAIIEYTLASQDTVISATTDGGVVTQFPLVGTIPASTTNTVTVNPNGIFSDGTFLFNESSDQDDFLTVTSNSTGLPLDLLRESLVTTVGQDFTGETVFGGSDLANALSILDDLGMASFGANFTTDFSPTADASNGDFIARVETNSFPALQVIPEPASLALLIVGMSILCGTAYRRRHAIPVT